jgi:hypothetical protein
MNTYDVVNADVLVLTESAAKIFTEVETETESITFYRRWSVSG